jgi:cell division protease FtsH
VTEQLPLVERHLYGEDYLTATLAVRLGGRAAELTVLGQGSTGAATDLATKMVCEFGLSSALGPVGYPEGGSVFLGGGGGPGLSSRPFAEAIQAVIDAEVARLLREAEERATGLLGAHRGELSQLTDLLLTRRPSTAPPSTGSPGGPLPPRRPVPPSAPPLPRPRRERCQPAGRRHS